MSESVEMYLVMTAMLRTNGNPVPLSALADNLSISSASANEMCRKLEERGLVDYQPYKGVTLTSEGEAIAQHVLSRRRLWMAFLVESLGLDPHEADAIACRLEHVTSEHLVEALAAFLSRLTPACPPVATVSPKSSMARPTTHPLIMLPPGARGQIVAITTDAGLQDLLRIQGLQPGATIAILAVGAYGALIIQAGEQHLSLARALAAQIEVAPLADQPPLLRCAQDMCQGLLACLHGAAQTSEERLCPRLLAESPGTRDG